MKDLFEQAYEGICEAVETLLDMAMDLGKLILTCLVYLSAPLWFIPYLIYKSLHS